LNSDASLPLIEELQIQRTGSFAVSRGTPAIGSAFGLRASDLEGTVGIVMRMKQVVPVAFAAILLCATGTGAQMPPPMPAPMVPNLNPSGSLTLPPTTEAPVSPVTPGTLPGSTAPGVGDAAGIYAPEPMGVFHHHHHHRRRRHGAADR